MSDRDLEHFEKLLMGKRSKLVHELESIEEANLSSNQTDQGGELSGYTNHLADAASDYTTLETNLGLAEREGKYLINIEEALDRIRKKTYGICKICKNLIPKARLEAVPTATKCVNCKQETKKREAVEQQQELARMFAKISARKQS
ncbi:MAG TPA: TraR/DksA C4-type zinc finger protein [Fibrobacteraceae bacterium]|nr:TraR/DksA C4-type zinc finger protein [Fibrobacteraceae bacterium]